MIRAICAALAFATALSSHALALDIQSTTTPGRIPGVTTIPGGGGATYGKPLTDGELASNRAD